MQISKLIFLTIFLSACSGGKDPVSTSANLNTFLVDPITAQVEDASRDAAFGLPTSRQVNFTACVKDVAVMEPIIGANFQVSGGERTMQPATTDAKGCFYWSEQFSVTATEAEKYIEITRTIEALSMHKGMVTLKLAVNPWRTGGDSVKDLRFQAPPPGLSANQENNIYGFEIGRIEATDSVVKAMDSTGRPSELEIEFKGCVRNASNKERVINPDLTFSVQMEGQESSQKPTPEEGCLKWKRSFAFDYYGKETFMQREVSIQSTNSYFGQQVVQRIVHIDLWNYENLPKIVVDGKYDGTPSLSVAEKGGNAELVLSSSFFTYMGRSFHLDSHLNLSTTRTYRFELQPKIRRLSRDKGWLPPQGSGNGRYQIRFLLETTDPDMPEVLDAKVMEVESRADSITATVGFTLQDIRQAFSRAVLSVEVLPMDRASSLVTQPYTGIFDMLGGFTVRYAPRNGSIVERMKLAGQPNKALRKSGKEIFMSAKKFEILTPEKLTAIGTSQNELDQYLTTGKKEYLGNLCGLYFKDRLLATIQILSLCKKNPEKFLAIGITEHANKIHNSKPFRSETSALTFAAAVAQTQYTSEDHTESHSKSDTIEAGAKVSVPFLDLIGINVGFGVGGSESWTTTNSITKGKSKTKSHSSDLSKQMIVEELEFQINASVDRCIIVANLEEKSPVYMGCKSKPVEKGFTESYYLVYQPMNNGALLDSGSSLAERPFMSLIRGKGRFKNFVSIVQDPAITLNISNDLPIPAELMKEAENRYDGFFPGLLTPAK